MATFKTLWKAGAVALAVSPVALSPVSALSPTNSVTLSGTNYIVENYDFSAFAVATNIMGGLFSSGALNANLTWAASTSCALTCGFGASTPYGFSFTGTTGDAINTMFGAGSWSAGVNYNISGVVNHVYTYVLNSVTFTQGGFSITSNVVGPHPTVQIATVPGPIAGAGLPLLAMAGAFGLVRRRRNLPRA